MSTNTDADITSKTTHSATAADMGSGGDVPTMAKVNVGGGAADSRARHGVGDSKTAELGSTATTSSNWPQSDVAQGTVGGKGATPGDVYGSGDGGSGGTGIKDKLKSAFKG